MSDVSAKSLIPFYVIVAMGFFLDGLDGTIVTIALPTIGESFGIDTGASSWIVTIYFLFMAGLVLIMGRFAGSGHLRPILAGGFAVFAIASLLCALSVNLEMMLVFRAVQGIGGAMLASSAVLVPIRFLPAGKLAFGMAMALMGSALGSAMGPVFGGIITGMLSWHWVFLINVPIGLIMALFVMRIIPGSEERTEIRFDKIGSILLFFALICGLYVLEASPSSGLTGIILLLAVLFVILFAVFVVFERRADDPVLDLGLFRSWKFDAVTFAYAAVNVFTAGTLYLVPFYLSIVLGMSAMTSGLVLFIYSAVILLLCIPVSESAGKRGHRLYAGLSMLMIIVASAVMAAIDISSSPIFIIIALIAMGLMWGFGSGSISARMLLAAPKEKMDQASSIVSFMIYFGSAVGTALFSGLFVFGSGTSGTPISELLPGDFMTGFHFVMIIAIVIGILALIASFSVKEER